MTRMYKLFCFLLTFRRMFFRLAFSKIAFLIVFLRWGLLQVCAGVFFADWSCSNIIMSHGSFENYLCVAFIIRMGCYFFMGKGLKSGQARVSFYHYYFIIIITINIIVIIVIVIVIMTIFSDLALPPFSSFTRYYQERLLLKHWKGSL